jgi:hypothetical protein
MVGRATKHRQRRRAIIAGTGMPLARRFRHAGAAYAPPRHGRAVNTSEK